MPQLVQLRCTCDHGNVCPTLHYQPDSDDFLVQGTARYQAARDVAWDMAGEFTSWWADHPQYHRANHRVA